LVCENELIEMADIKKGPLGPFLMSLLPLKIFLLNLFNLLFLSAGKESHL